MIRTLAAQAVAVAVACVRHVRHEVPTSIQATEDQTACAAIPVAVTREAVVPVASAAVVRRVEAIRGAAVVRAVIAAVAAHVRVEATAAAEALAAEAAVVRVAAALAAAVEAAAVTVPGRAVAVDSTTHCREKEKTS